MIAELLIHVIKIAAVIGVMLGIVAYTVMAERWVSAWIQDRIGPNRVGPFGLLQPLARTRQYLPADSGTKGP